MIPSMQQKAAEPQLVGPYLVAHISIPRDWPHVPHFPIGRGQQGLVLSFPPPVGCLC